MPARPPSPSSRRVRAPRSAAAPPPHRPRLLPARRSPRPATCRSAARANAPRSAARAPHTRTGRTPAAARPRGSPRRPPPRACPPRTACSRCPRAPSTSLPRPSSATPRVVLAPAARARSRPAPRLPSARRRSPRRTSHCDGRRPCRPACAAPAHPHPPPAAPKRTSSVSVVCASLAFPCSPRTSVAFAHGCSWTRPSCANVSPGWRRRAGSPVLRDGCAAARAGEEGPVR